MIFALVGNQELRENDSFNASPDPISMSPAFPVCGKDQKMGDIIDEKAAPVDLPGIYSPTYTRRRSSPVTLSLVKPDGIINIVDATNIERNLYLTLQLLELRVPMVLALSMMDEVRSNGGSIDVQKMSASLGIPCHYRSRPQRVRA